MLGPIRYCGHLKLMNHASLAVNSNALGQMIINLASRVHYSKTPDECKGSSTTPCTCKDVAQTAGRRVEAWPKPDPPPQPWRAECPREPQPPNYDPYRIKVPDVVVPPLPPSNAKPMLDCAKMKGSCSLKPFHEPPPGPPPTPPPYTNSLYLLAILSVFGAFGLMFRFWVWWDQKTKQDESRAQWRPRRKFKSPYSETDLPPCVQYLIIGTGAAGWAAYRAIMEHDKKARVFFITREDMVPYKRPPMSKQMWLNEDPPDIKLLRYVEDMQLKSMLNAQCSDFLDPVSFYRKKNGPALSIATGWCVLRIDADDHVAYIKTMGGERPIYYERCLLAPGSAPRNLDVFKSAPKNVRARICKMRTIRDLEVSFRKVREAKSVVIIGGGCLGCELAWHIGRMNKIIERPDEMPPLQIMHVYKDKGILSSILPEYLGEWAAEIIKCEGVTMVPKTQVYDAFESPDGRLELTLSNGESLVCDYAFLCIGAEPRVDMAENSYLEQDPVNGGYLVNTEMEARTHLYIAGDAASYYSQWKDTRMRSDHYQNAEEQGYIAGANMTGYWTPCNMEPNYHVKLGEHLNMEVVGEVGACMPIIGVFKECDDQDSVDEANEIAGGTLASGKRKCYKDSTLEYQNRYKRGLLFYMRDETVVGFVFWNLPPIDDRRGVATELLRAKPTYRDINVLAQLLGFPEARCVYKKAVKEAEKEVCLTKDCQPKPKDKDCPTINRYRY